MSKRKSRTNCVPKEQRYRRQFRKYITLCVIFLLFAGCSNVTEYYYFFLGNRHYTAGSYTDALRHYLRASEQKNSYITYNLGLVYVALGESESAHRAWHISELSSSKMLSARAYFNNGVLYYQEANFEQAYQSFREALRRDPQDSDAKRYLELSYQRTTGVERTQEVTVSAAQETEEFARILDYIQRLESSNFGTVSESKESFANDW